MQTKSKNKKNIIKNLKTTRKIHIKAKEIIENHNVQAKVQKGIQKQRNMRQKVYKKIPLSSFCVSDVLLDREFTRKSGCYTKYDYTEQK